MTDKAQGFFSLARANSSAPAGQRYGEDYYDFRMQALRRVHVNEDRKFDVLTRVQPEKKIVEDLEKLEVTDETVEEVEKSEDDESSNDATEKDKSPKEQEQRPKIDPATQDPIRWFGMVVPSTLRDSQKTFTLAVQDAVPAVVNAAAEMHQLEIEIGRTRKAIRKLEKHEQSIMSR